MKASNENDEFLLSSSLAFFFFSPLSNCFSDAPLPLISLRKNKIKAVPFYIHTKVDICLLVYLSCQPAL